MWHVWAGNNASTNATDAAAYKRLKDFTVGISGGSPVPRSKYVFDNLNLPTVRHGTSLIRV